MVKTYIHVNQHNIKANAKRDAGLPVLTVKDTKLLNFDAAR